MVNVARTLYVMIVIIIIQLQCFIISSIHIRQSLILIGRRDVGLGCISLDTFISAHILFIHRISLLNLNETTRLKINY